MRWPIARLGQVAEVNPRDRDLRDWDPRTEVSFVPMAAVSELTAAIEDKQTRRLEDVRKGFTAFREGDLLIAKITPCMENGKVAIAVPLVNGRGFGSTEFHVIRPKTGLDVRFLYHFVRQQTFRSAARARMRGAAGQQRVPEEFIREYPLPVPPPAEQRHIVEILDQADRLRRLRAEAAAKVDRILPALHQNMFLRPGSSWPTRALGSRLRKKKGALQSGPFGTHLHNSDFVEDGPVRVVGIDNVLDGEFVLGRDRRIGADKYRDLMKYTLAPGDVLLTIMGTVGRCCVFPPLPETAICTKHVYRIQVDETLDPDYVSAAIRYSPLVRAQLGTSVTGQIVAGITSDAIRQFQITIPPRGLQAQFALHVRAIAQQRTESRRAEAQLNGLFQALLRNAFSGALTGRWRDAHMGELLQEMEQQTRALGDVAP